MEGMRVFIDANIYLNFFKPSEEKMTSLGLLRKNLKKQKINLIFPKITQDELLRNLSVIRSKYIRELRTLKMVPPATASVIKGKAQTNKIQDLANKIKSELGKLEGSYIKYSDKLLKNDIEYLIKNSISPNIDDDVFELAKRRRFIGNPPGKSDGRFHIGDELVWEILLKSYGDDDLVIVSNDGDWKKYPQTQRGKQRFRQY